MPVARDMVGAVIKDDEQISTKKLLDDLSFKYSLSSGDLPSELQLHGVCFTYTTISTKVKYYTHDDSGDIVTRILSEVPDSNGISELNSIDVGFELGSNNKPNLTFKVTPTECESGRQIFLNFLRSIGFEKYSESFERVGTIIEKVFHSNNYPVSSMGLVFDRDARDVTGVKVYYSPWAVENHDNNVGTADWISSHSCLSEIIEFVFSNSMKKTIDDIACLVKRFYEEATIYIYGINATKNGFIDVKWYYQFRPDFSSEEVGILLKQLADSLSIASNEIREVNDTMYQLGLFLPVLAIGIGKDGIAIKTYYWQREYLDEISKK